MKAGNECYDLDGPMAIGSLCDYVNRVIISGTASHQSRTDNKPPSPDPSPAALQFEHTYSASSCKLLVLGDSAILVCCHRLLTVATPPELLHPTSKATCLQQSFGLNHAGCEAPLMASKPFGELSSGEYLCTEDSRLAENKEWLYIFGRID